MIKFKNFIVINLFLIIVLVSTKSFSENHNVLEVLELIQKDLKTLEKAVYSGSLDDNSNNLVFRIRIMKFKKGDSSINDLNIIKSFAQNMRDKIIIKGIIICDFENIN